MIHATGYLAWAGASTYFTVRSAGEGRWCATVGSQTGETVLSVLASAPLGDGHYYGPTATLIVPTPTPTATPTATTTPTPTPTPTATTTPTATATPLPALPVPFVGTYGYSLLLWGSVEHAAGYEVRWRTEGGEWQEASLAAEEWSYDLGDLPPGVPYEAQVRTLGDNQQYRHGEWGYVFLITLPTPTATATATATPTITPTPLPTLPPQLPPLAAVEVVGGQLRWTELTGAHGYSIRAVFGELPASGAVGTTGSETWQARALADLPLADGYCVKANGDGETSRNSEELCAALPSAPTPTPGSGPTSTATATATATAALTPLDAPGDVTVTGSLVSWQAMTGAAGYRLELRRAGARVLVAELEAEAGAEGTAEDGQALVRYRLEGLEAGAAHVVDVQARGDGLSRGDSVWSRSEEFEPEALDIVPNVTLVPDYPILFIKWGRLADEELGDYEVSYRSKAPGETEFGEEKKTYISPLATHLFFTFDPGRWDPTMVWQARVRARHAFSDGLHGPWSGWFTWYPPPTPTVAPTSTPKPPRIYVDPTDGQWCSEYVLPTVLVELTSHTSDGRSINYLDPPLLFEEFTDEVKAFVRLVKLGQGDIATWFQILLEYFGLSDLGIRSPARLWIIPGCFPSELLDPTPPKESHQVCAAFAEIMLSEQGSLSLGPRVYDCMVVPGSQPTGPTATATATPTPTPTPTPEQLPAPAVVKFVGRTLCWKRVENASGYNINITTAGPRGASDVIGSVDPDPCGTPGTDWQSRYYESPAWGERYCVAARGDGILYLTSEERCTLAVQPTPTPATPATATATPSATATRIADSLPRRDTPGGLKLVNGSSLCWRKVAGPQNYTTRRVPASQLPERDAGAAGAAAGQGPRNPCGGVLWGYRHFDALTPGDVLSVVALGNGRSYRDSLPAYYHVPDPATATPRPTNTPTPVPPPTATATPTATAAPVAQQLAAPAVVKFVGQTLCWKRVANASSYSVSVSTAGPRGASDVTGDVDPDPCGTPGTDWQSRYYESPAWGERHCVKARGDGVRYLDSEERCTTLAAAPTSVPPPPTSAPPPPAPPATAVPEPPQRVAVFVYYNEYRNVPAGQLCQRQERRCRKTCWQGTNTCWNHGQACTGWSNHGSPSQCFVQDVPPGVGT